MHELRLPVAAYQYHKSTHTIHSVEETIISRPYAVVVPVHASCELSSIQTPITKETEGITELGCSLLRISPGPSKFLFFGPISTRLVLLEDTQQALPDLPRLLAGVNTAPDAGFLVIVANGGGLSVVGSETLGQGLGIVVGTLN